MDVFVDTNVLLDVLAEREPFYGASLRVWTLAEEGTIRGLVSAISFNNLYYIVRKLADRRTASRAMRLLRGTFVPVALGPQILNQAIDSGFRDLEDAIQFFSAVQAGATCLVTRNPRHFPAGQIPIQTPAAFLAAHFSQ